MDAATIFVIVLVGLFVVGMTAIMILRNTPPKDGPRETPGKRE